MAGPLAHLIDDSIRFILLDMDGTLLDRYFDDHFWEHLLPERFAELRGMTADAARADLLARYRREEKTLRWTDLDFWSEELGIDIPALKKQMEHLIDVHPHVVPFLKEMRRRGKTVVLVTNAHYKVLDIKLARTALGQYLDLVYTSGELGYPKEWPEFWTRLGDLLEAGYEKASVLVDDTEAVLHTARDFGIRHCIFKALANSSRPPGATEHFPAIQDFSELMTTAQT